MTGLKVGGAIVDCGVPGSVAPLDVPVLVLADVEDKWWNGCVVNRWPAWITSRVRLMARRAAEAWVTWPNKKEVYQSQGHGGPWGGTW